MALCLAHGDAECYLNVLNLPHSVGEALACVHCLHMQVCIFSALPQAWVYLISSSCCPLRERLWLYLALTYEMVYCEGTFSLNSQDFAD